MKHFSVDPPGASFYASGAHPAPQRLIGLAALSGLHILLCLADETLHLLEHHSPTPLPRIRAASLRFSP